MRDSVAGDAGRKSRSLRRRPFTLTTVKANGRAFAPVPHHAPRVALANPLATKFLRAAYCMAMAPKTAAPGVSASAFLRVDRRLLSGLRSPGSAFPR